MRVAIIRGAGVAIITHYRCSCAAGLRVAIIGSAGVLVVANDWSKYTLTVHAGIGSAKTQVIANNFGEYAAPVNTRIIGTTIQVIANDRREHADAVYTGVGGAGVLVVADNRFVYTLAIIAVVNRAGVLVITAIANNRHGETACVRVAFIIIDNIGFSCDTFRKLRAGAQAADKFGSEFGFAEFPDKRIFATPAY